MYLQHVPVSFSEHHDQAEKDIQRSLDSVFIIVGDKWILLSNDTSFQVLGKKKGSIGFFFYNTLTKF